MVDLHEESEMQRVLEPVNDETKDEHVSVKL